jgi:predicted dehydrogenase
MKGEGSFVKMETNNAITGHQQCIEEWIKSLRGDKASIVTEGTDSRKTVEVAEAAYRSEATGMVVKIPIEPQPWK